MTSSSTKEVLSSFVDDTFSAKDNIEFNQTLQEEAKDEKAYTFNQNDTTETSTTNA